MPPRGRVHAINVSNGGVPKLPKPSVRITAQGVEGDRQRDRRIHGGPDRAVLVYSLEQIESLQREGHPIAPCENIAGSFVDGELTRVSKKLRLGWSRFCTRALQEGSVNVDDAVVVSRPLREDP